jgi:hypothetical protein
MSTLYITTRTILIDFLNYGLANYLFYGFNVKALGRNSNSELVYEVTYKTNITEDVDAYYIYTFEKPTNGKYMSLRQPELEPLPF